MGRSHAHPWVADGDVWLQYRSLTAGTSSPDLDTYSSDAHHRNMQPWW